MIQVAAAEFQSCRIQIDKASEFLCRFDVISRAKGYMKLMSSAQSPIPRQIQLSRTATPVRPHTAIHESKDTLVVVGPEVLAIYFGHCMM